MSLQCCEVVHPLLSAVFSLIKLNDIQSDGTGYSTWDSGAGFFPESPHTSLKREPNLGAFLVRPSGFSIVPSDELPVRGHSLGR